MAYGKATCAECKQKLMAQDGIVPEHTVPGSVKIKCDGSGEPSLEADIDDESEYHEEVEVAKNANGAHFKIEKGIPIPPRNGGRESKFDKILSELQVGDSFLVPCKSRAYPQRLRLGAKKLGHNLTARRVSDTEIRVWRIK